MSESHHRQTVALGDVDPAGSRHQGRRSAVALTEDCVVVGTADGDVLAIDRATGTEQWRVPGSGDASVVGVTPFDGSVAVSERGPDGAVRVYDAEGSLRWRYDTATDVGDPQKETRFFLPFVVDSATDGDRLYVAARRYKRRGDRRHFESVVYAFEGDGEIAWRYGTDASPIALAVDDGRVAVAYNRCTGDHQHGLVILDSDDCCVGMLWDPGTEGQRRVGDVALVEDDVLLCCHGDYRGYRLDGDGAIQWTADLATPRQQGDETVYAYPNHVHATDAGVVFVTGNTYPEDGREADSLHPEEHTAVGYSPDGERRWSTSVEGFASGIATDGDTVAVPSAQNFRRRDPDGHGCRLLSVADGLSETIGTDGIVTAGALDGETVVAVEEPVVYHDDGEERGAYRVYLRSR